MYSRTRRADREQPKKPGSRALRDLSGRGEIEQRKADSKQSSGSSPVGVRSSGDWRRRYVASMTPILNNSVRLF